MGSKGTMSCLRMAGIFLFLLLPACSHLGPGPPVTGEAAERAQFLMSGIKAGNLAVGAVKGIGRISLEDAGAVQSTRAAWVAAPDGRIRMEMLGPTGHSVAKFIFDGNTYAYVSHLDQQVHTYSRSNLNLGPLMGVAVPADDMVFYLVGGIPLREYDHMDLVTDDATGHPVLVLTKRWRGTVQKIYPDMERQTVNRVEVFNRWGQLAYRADLGRFRQVNERQIPFSIQLTDEDGNGLRIDSDNYWTDVSLAPEMFSIAPVQRETPRF
jgi:outer membrane lipoprotein-sorting protein